MNKSNVEKFTLSTNILIILQLTFYDRVVTVLQFYYISALNINKRTHLNFYISYWN
jgi:hypothetical protein